MATHVLFTVFRNMELYSLVEVTKFQRNVLPPSSRHNSSALKMEATIFSEMSVNIYQATHRRISED
jgi:hypothetical protein